MILSPTCTRYIDVDPTMHVPSSIGPPAPHKFTVMMSLPPTDTHSSDDHLHTYLYKYISDGPPTHRHMLLMTQPPTYACMVVLA